MDKMKKTLKRIGSLVLCLCMALTLMPTLPAAAADYTATFNIPAETVTSNLSNIQSQGFGTLKSVTAYVAYQDTKDTKMTFTVSSSGTAVTQGGYSSGQALTVSNGSITGSLSLTSDTYYLILLLTDTNGVTASTGYSVDAASTDGVTYYRSGNQKSTNDTQTEIATAGLRLMVPTVTVEVDGNGTISASGSLKKTGGNTYTVKAGDTLTLTATPTSTTEAPYYGFYTWYKDSDTSTSYDDNPYTTAAITANTTYKAVFKEAPYQVDGTNYVLLADASDAAKNTTDKTITMTSVPDTGSTAYGDHSFTNGMKLVATDGTTYTGASDKVGVWVKSGGVVCVNGMSTTTYDKLMPKGKLDVSAGGSVTVITESGSTAVTVTSSQAFTIDSTNIPAEATNLSEGQSVTIGGITYTAGNGTTSYSVTGATLTNTDDAATVPAGTAATITVDDSASVEVPSTNTGATTVTKTASGSVVTLAKAGDSFTAGGTTYTAGTDNTKIAITGDASSPSFTLESGSITVPVGTEASINISDGTNTTPVTIGAVSSISGSGNVTVTKTDDGAEVVVPAGASLNADTGIDYSPESGTNTYLVTGYGSNTKVTLKDGTESVNFTDQPLYTVNNAITADTTGTAQVSTDGTTDIVRVSQSNSFILNGTATYTADDYAAYTYFKIGADGTVTQLGSEENPIEVSDADSLAAAVASAPTNGTAYYIKLTGDCTDLASSLTIPSGANIVLDLNGKTISSASTSTTPTVVVERTGKLTVKDSSSDESGKIVGNSNSTQSVGSDSTQGTSEKVTGIYVAVPAKLDIQGGTITDDSTDGYTSGLVAVYMEGSNRNRNSEFSMSGGTVDGKLHMNDLIGKADGSTTVLSGGTVTGDLEADNETMFTISGGTVKGSLLTDNGDYLISGGTFMDAQKSTVSENLAEGCEIQDNEDGTFTVLTPEQVANNWKTTYKDILSKTTDTVTADDLDAIEAALAAYNELSDDAKSYLTEEKALLDSLKASIKDNANEEDDAAVQAAKDAVDALSNLTDEEKQAYKDKIDAAAQTAKDAIDAATTGKEITEAQSALKDALDSIQSDAEAQDLANAKTKANSEIDSAAADAKAAIDALTDLTDAEKQALKDKIDAAVKTAKEAVDAATDEDGISAAKDALTKALASIQSDAEAQDLANAKTKANAEIDKAAQAEKDAIDALTDLSDAEKQARKDAVDAAAKAAKDAVNAATNKAGISTALNDLTKALAAIQTEAEALDASNKIKDESGLSGNDLVKRSDLPFFLAKVKRASTKSAKVTWRKVSGATGYEVYGTTCGKTHKYKKLKTVKASATRAYTQTKLKQNKSYKYFVVAYKMVDGKKVYIGKSPVIHVAMKKWGTTNAKKVTVNKSSVTLKTSTVFQIKAKVTKQDSKKKLLTHAKKLRYYTTNAKVAKVSKSGKITAKAKGSCKIYVVANNGVYKTVSVTVK